MLEYFLRKDRHEIRKEILRGLTPLDIISVFEALYISDKRDLDLYKLTHEEKQFMIPARQIFKSLSWIEELRADDPHCTITLIGKDIVTLGKAIQSWKYIPPSQLHFLLAITSTDPLLYLTTELCLIPVVEVNTTWNRTWSEYVPFTIREGYDSQLAVVLLKRTLWPETPRAWIELDKPWAKRILVEHEYQSRSMPIHWPAPFRPIMLPEGIFFNHLGYIDTGLHRWLCWFDTWHIDLHCFGLELPQPLKAQHDRTFPIYDMNEEELYYTRWKEELWGEGIWSYHERSFGMRIAIIQEPGPWICGPTHILIPTKKEKDLLAEELHFGLNERRVPKAFGRSARV